MSILHGKNDDLDELLSQPPVGFGERIGGNGIFTEAMRIQSLYCALPYARDFLMSELSNQQEEIQFWETCEQKLRDMENNCPNFSLEVANVCIFYHTFTKKLWRDEELKQKLNDYLDQKYPEFAAVSYQDAESVKKFLVDLLDKTKNYILKTDAIEMKETDNDWFCEQNAITRYYITNRLQPATEYLCRSELELFRRIYFEIITPISKTINRRRKCSADLLAEQLDANAGDADHLIKMPIFRKYCNRCMQMCAEWMDQIAAGAQQDSAYRKKVISNFYQKLDVSEAEIKVPTRRSAFTSDFEYVKNVILGNILAFRPSFPDFTAADNFAGGIIAIPTVCDILCENNFYLYHLPMQELEEIFSETVYQTCAQSAVLESGMSFQDIEKCTLFSLGKIQDASRFYERLTVNFTLNVVFKMFRKNLSDHISYESKVLRTFYETRPDDDTSEAETKEEPNDLLISQMRSQLAEFRRHNEKTRAEVQASFENDLRTLEKKLEKSEKQNEVMRETIEEQQKLIEGYEEAYFTDSDEDGCEENQFSIEELRKRRLLFVGGREDTNRRLKEILPNSVWISNQSSSRDLQTEHFDAVIFFPTYLSHKVFYKYVNDCRKNRTEFFLINTQNPEITLQILGKKLK